MGKKRLVKTEQDPAASSDKASSGEKSEEVKSSRRRVDSGVLYVESTYNNTKLTLTDNKYNTVAWSSSGSLGFKGAKKGTPFAAAKVGETLALKAQTLGVKEVKVIVKGVGSGRESAIRGFISKGINLTTIQDKTAVPHNGPKPPKPRRT
jgi:small subunit ribosomal protein S11